MSANGSTLNSSFSSTSTIRPRNRRLISYTDDPDSDTAPSPYSSRNGSPIPRTHLSRRDNDTGSPSRQKDQRNGAGLKAGQRSTSTFATSNTSSSGGLWESSWSSLQGLASSLLGNDAESSNHGGTRSRTPMGMARWRQASESTKSSAPSSWGPKANTNMIAAGTQEERRALVQAKKREVLMRADADKLLDARGNHKRRDSDGQALTPSDQQQDEDALVYVHRVRPQDTLAGVMIRYGCQPAVFRKVNRFWPNDNIQVRKTILVPIEACSVRGKRVEPDLVELVENDSGETSFAGSKLPDNVSTPQMAPSDAEHGEPSWRHEYFVLIDGIPESVEVGRVSRRTLGFFPPSRRKSVCFSDLGATPNGSRNPSLDLSSQISIGNSGSPSRPSTLPRRPSHRHRSSSIASQGNQQILSRLRGPGGVGNLSGRMAIAPGPAPDSLNRIFAPHLPNVEPPDSLLFLVEDDDGVGSYTSRASSSTSGLENLGGAIEGWVRKLAGKVSATSSSTTQARNSGTMTIGGWIPTGLGGDLIELGETPLEFSGNSDGSGILGSSPAERLPFPLDSSPGSKILSTTASASASSIGRTSSGSGFRPSGSTMNNLHTPNNDNRLRERGTSSINAQKATRSTQPGEDDGKWKDD